MKTGSVPSTDMAAILAQKVDCEPKYWLICTVKVMTSVRVRTSANRNSFQENTKAKIAVAIRPLRAIGTVTFHNTLRCE